MFRKRNQKERGFTLIELLISVTIITILAVSVFVALNPAQRIKDANDARRTTDVDTILTAIHEYIVDNDGAYPTGLAASTPISQLGTAASGCAGPIGAATECNATNLTATACKDLTTPLAPYLKSIPQDPTIGSAVETAYAVEVNANGIVTITACNTEGGAGTITASR